MIVFNYETPFELPNEIQTQEWIQKVVADNGFEIGEINYVFCDDNYLHKLNVEFLNHDTLTDIISFDNTLGKLISGDIFISIDRVLENAGTNFIEQAGEAAFYGPKADFMVRDCIGRSWQLGTIQVDYNLPERFELEYVGSDNQPHRPVMIHRAPFGSMERFMGVLIEHDN